MFDRIGGFFTECSNWIWRMMLLNWIWFLHVLFGGVVLGIFPATVSLFATTREWLNGGIDKPIWKNYHAYYKRNFWKTNGLGWIYLLVGGFLILDLYLVSQIQGMVALLSTLAIILLLIVYLFSFLYFFSYYVHFEQSFTGYLLQPFIITFISYKQNFLIGFGLFVVGYLIFQLPGLIPFALGVMPAYWIMKVSLNRYKQMQEKWENAAVEGGKS
ncbi:YesL family protein [Alteribacter populi]|uniref:YesL family protein n=1 Tax=Alteribacter populi TaxID=2011011 RepID=UPI000BBAC75A|nr:YesL family protein [Alteribacter populi]